MELALSLGRAGECSFCPRFSRARREFKAVTLFSGRLWIADGAPRSPLDVLLFSVIVSSPAGQIFQERARKDIKATRVFGRISSEIDVSR